MPIEFVEPKSTFKHYTLRSTIVYPVSGRVRRCEFQRRIRRTACPPRRTVFDRHVISSSSEHDPVPLSSSIISERSGSFCSKLPSSPLCTPRRRLAITVVKNTRFLTVETIEFETRDPAVRHEKHSRRLSHRIRTHFKVGHLFFPYTKRSISDVQNDINHK